MAGELPRRPATRPLRAAPTPEAGTEEQIRMEYLAEIRAAARTRNYLLGRTADAYTELVTNIDHNHATRVRLAQDRHAARLAELGGQAI